jgi:hypothetical protein
MTPTDRVDAARVAVRANLAAQKAMRQAGAATAAPIRDTQGMLSDASSNAFIGKPGGR